MVRILYVEDEADLREDLAEVLVEEGFEVAVAVDGAEALTLLANFNPELIISDCLMPVMTGKDMLNTIRTEMPGFAKLPVIFLSANARKEQIEEGIEVGADYYLAKPVDYGQLLKAVNSLLHRKSAAAAQVVELQDAGPASLAKAE
jgi:CheY-like chemotaxis protein